MTDFCVIDCAVDDVPGVILLLFNHSGSIDWGGANCIVVYWLGHLFLFLQHDNASTI